MTMALASVNPDESALLPTHPVNVTVLFAELAVGCGLV
jgi:hypothetical protein